MDIWIVLVKKGGELTVHSAHKDVTTARQWSDCLEYEGKDTEIAKSESEVFSDLLEGGE